MSELSQSTKKLIDRYKSWYQSTQSREGVLTVHVDEVASAVAAFYEKMRGIVDWREEHLMRKAAMERMLKRRMLLAKSADEATAEGLVMELIRGGHFPNDKVPEVKIKEVQRLIDKYLFIFETSPQATKENQKVRLYDWLLSIAACELEEILSPSIRERALIDYMTEFMEEKIKLREGVLVVGGMTEEEKNTQIYIAVQKALLKLDYPLISYSLLKRKIPQWQALARDDDLLQEIGRKIYSIWDKTAKDLRHPLADKFYKICERYDTPYLIMGDIISEDPTGIEKKIEVPEELEAKINWAYQKRLAKLKSKIRRAAIYVTLSIFITKISLALLIETPIDIKITHSFSYVTMAINIITPPLLMLLMILSIRPPGKDNLQRVIMEVMKIAYPNERKEAYPIDKTRKRGFMMNLAIILFYTVTYVVSFGLIIYGLTLLHFGALSIVIFLIFVSLISFAGIKLRDRSRELEVSAKKDSFLIGLIELFSIPIIRMGKWLSSQWAQYNVIAISLNFLVDWPFQRFVEFLEQWRGFMKEKKEEIH